MLSILADLEALVYARRRDIDRDDADRIARGKHRRFGACRVVSDEDAGGDGYGIASGGAFNTDRAERAAYGVTKADATSLRRAAAKLGVQLSPETAEALLFEAVAGASATRACRRCGRPILSGATKYCGKTCRDTMLMRRKRAAKKGELI